MQAFLLILSLVSVGMWYTLAAGSVFSVWVGVEVVSLATIMGILVAGGSSSSNFVMKSAVMLKYIYLQMVLGACVLLVLSLSGGGGMAWLLVLILGVKASVFPGHAWVVDIYGSLSLWECVILGVVPKVSLFILLFSFVLEGGGNVSAFLVALLSIILGSALGAGVSDLRQVLACSAVVSGGWLIFSCSSLGTSGWGGFTWFFVMYAIMTLSVFFFLAGVVGIPTKLSTASWGGGIGGSVGLGAATIFLLGMCGMPCTILFVFKAAIILYASGGWEVFMVLGLSFISALFYSRLLILSWGGLGSGALGAEQNVLWVTPWAWGASMVLLLSMLALTVVLCLFT